jgi:hypothetical protein
MPTNPRGLCVIVNTPAGKAGGGVQIKTPTVRPVTHPTKTALAATGWQLHTLRALISGLRKRCHAISRWREDGEARYAISNREGCQ